MVLAMRRGKDAQHRRHLHSESEVVHIGGPGTMPRILRQREIAHSSGGLVEPRLVANPIREPSRRSARSQVEDKVELCAKERSAPGDLIMQKKKRMLRTLVEGSSVAA